MLKRSRVRFRLARTRVARAGLHFAHAESHKFAPDRSIVTLNAARIARVRGLNIPANARHWLGELSVQRFLICNLLNFIPVCNFDAKRPTPLNTSKPAHVSEKYTSGHARY